MPNYTNLAKTAQRLLTNFGASVLYVDSVRNTYDPVTNTIITAAQEYSVKGAKLNYSLGNVDGENIKQGDVRLLMEARGLPVTPSPDGEVLIGDVRWKVISVLEINPAAIPVYYELQLRK